MGKPPLWIAMLAGMGGWLIPRFYFGVPFDTMLAALAAAVVATLIGYPVGLLVGHFLSRDADVDTAPYRIVAGANLVAWLIPVAGITVSAVTWCFSRRSETTPTFYSWLGCIGGLVALANAGLGGAREYTQRHAAFPSPQVNESPSATVHSPERCPYAAIEAWPGADVEKYCKRPR